MLSPMTIVVFMMYVSSFVMVMSFEEWFLVWLGLEINMMMFLLLSYERGNVFISEGLGRYFFVQSLASGGLVGLLYLGWDLNLWVVLLGFKLGLGPFYFWYVSVVKELSWGGNFFLMTFQKVLPLYLLSEFGGKFLLVLGVMSVGVGLVGSYSQVLVSVLLGFSSVHHSGWLAISMMVGDFLWVLYMVVYFVMMWMVIYIFSVWEVVTVTGWGSKMGKEVVVVMVLVLGGIPPFMGFLLKWVAFSYFIKVSIGMMFILMLASAGMLYVYLRILYDVVLGSSMGMGWVAEEGGGFGGMEVLWGMSVVFLGLLMLLI